MAGFVYHVRAYSTLSTLCEHQGLIAGVVQFRDRVQMSPSVSWIPLKPEEQLHLLHILPDVLSSVEVERRSEDAA